MTTELRDYWGNGGQIFFCSGSAYGITPNLQTICIGKEKDILKTLQENKSAGNPVIDQILRMEKLSPRNTKIHARAYTKRTTINAQAFKDRVDRFLGV